MGDAFPDQYASVIQHVRMHLKLQRLMLRALCKLNGTQPRSFMPRSEVTMQKITFATEASTAEQKMHRSLAKLGMQSSMQASPAGTCPVAEMDLGSKQADHHKPGSGVTTVWSGATGNGHSPLPATSLQITPPAVSPSPLPSPLPSPQCATGSGISPSQRPRRSSRERSESSTVSIYRQLSALTAKLDNMAGALVEQQMQISSICDHLKVGGKSSQALGIHA